MKHYLMLLACMATHALGSPSTKSFTLPLSFEKNQGQFAGPVLYGIRTPNLTVSISHHEIAIRSVKNGKSHEVKMRFDGANGLNPVSEDPLPGKINYLLGSSPDAWKTGIATYKQIRCAKLYPGIDLILYATGDHLEYDFAVEPYANTKKISISFEGAERISVNKAGDLSVQFGEDAIIQHRPFVFQGSRSKPHKVNARYLCDGRRVSFQIDAYDRSRALVIDPVLSFSAVFGGSGRDESRAIVLDGDGDIYLTGSTTSLDFPIKNPAEVAPTSVSAHIFVAKIANDGSSLVYATYLGGTGSEYGNAIEVTPDKRAIIVGRTLSVDYPTTPNAPRRATNAVSAYSDCVLTKLSSNGAALEFSMTWGGQLEDFASKVRLDSAGIAYVAGTTASPDFLVTAGARNDIGKLSLDAGGRKAFVTAVDISNSQLKYSAVIGGSGVDTAFGLAVEPATGIAYVTGTTTSRDFPITSGVVQPTWPTTQSTGRTGFLTKLSANGAALERSTYLGSGGDTAIGGLTFDGGSTLTVAGTTNRATFPTSSLVTGPTAGTAQNFIFVANVPTSLQQIDFVFTYGGFLNIVNDLVLDVSGNLVVVGYNLGGSLQTSDALVAVETEPQDPSQSTSTNAFLTVISRANRSILYSTYLGGLNSYATGVTTDRLNNTYITGNAEDRYPANGGVYQQSYQTQVFLTKITTAASCQPTVSSNFENVVATGTNVPLTVSAPSGCNWIATSGAPWAQISTPSVNSGSATVNVTVQPNPGAGRMGQLSVGGRAVTISQASGCRVSLSKQSESFLAQGGNDRFSLLTSSSCLSSGATAQSDQPWVRISGSSGATFSYVVDPWSPTGGPITRSATISVASQTFTVTQTASSCSYSFSPSTLLLPVGARSGVINVTANNSNCGWSVVANDATWFNVLDSFVPKGSSSLIVQTAADSNHYRTGQLLFRAAGFADRRLWVTQASRGGAFVGGKLGVVRNSSNWLIDTNADRQLNTANGDISYVFGFVNAIPIVGDWDNTGRLRIGVYSEGIWYLDINGNGRWDGASIDKYIDRFGYKGAVPIVGDWDNTGKMRIGIYDAGKWYLDINGNFRYDAGVDRYVSSFGFAGSTPVVGDWDNSGVTRIGVYANGSWYLDMDASYSFSAQADLTVSNFGTACDVPVVGDWDGTGRQRIGLFREPNTCAQHLPADGRAYWYLDLNADFVFGAGDAAVPLGIGGDQPVLFQWP